MPTQPQFNPNMPPQMQAEAGVVPPKPDSQSTDPADSTDEGDILKGLEEHLNNISNQQKKYLADALSKYPDVIINVLGIINGPEVSKYFVELYKKYFQNSAQGQPQGGQPQAAPAEAPAPSAGPTMAPMSQPNQQSVMNPQPQAKATPTPPQMGV